MARVAVAARVEVSQTQRLGLDRAGTSPYSTTISATSAGRREGRAQRRRPVPRGSSWSANSASFGEHLADGLVAGEYDDERRLAGRLPRGVEDVGQHRPAADRVEDLGQPRLHARAEAGGQDDGSWFAVGRCVTTAADRRIG